MRAFTVGELISKLKTRGNYNRSLKLTDEVLRDFFDTAIPEVWGFLVAKYESYYTKRDDTYSTFAGTTNYGLPDDLFKLLGVDVEVGANEWVRLDRFGLSERNQTRGNGIFWGGSSGATRMRYRLEGDEIVLHPPPPDARRMRFIYVEAAPKITANDQSISFWNGWEKLAILIALKEIKFAYGEPLGDVVRLCDEQFERVIAEADGYDAGDAPAIQDVYSEAWRRGAQ